MNLEQFLASLPDDKKVRGDQFELLCQRALRREPNVSKVWLWSQYPGRDGADVGIDIVVKTKDNELWAVQCKNYTDTVQWHSVSTFVGASVGYHRRILITSHDDISRTVQKQFERLGIEHFPGTWFDGFDCSEQPYKRTKAVLRDYQKQAVAKVKAALKTDKYCTIVCPTGSGKTLIFSRIIGVKRFCYVVPSISLAAQSAKKLLRDYPSRRAIIVCSDQTTGRPDPEEHFAGIPVCKSIDEINAYPKHSIFVTHDSLWKVKQSGQQFDIVIGDEAHRLAKIEGRGHEIWDFDTPIVFGTATPKTLKSKLKNSDLVIHSMDDESRFGKEIVNLSVRKLIDDGFLSDYKILIMAVDSEETREFIESRKYVSSTAGTLNAQDAAYYIALEKAREEFDIHRAISYHHTIKMAKDAAKGLKALGFNAAHIEASTPSIQRVAILSKLHDGAVITNARTLQEGVDVPSLDAVCFASPKRSTIDIVQAVGRVLRLDPQNKDKTGYVILPVVVDKTNDIEKQINATNFEHIYRVIRYMANIDDAVRDEIEQIRTGDGPIAKTTGGGSRIIVSANIIGMDMDKLAENIKLHIVDAIPEDWWSKARRCVADYEAAGRPIKGARSEFFKTWRGWIGEQKSWEKDPKRASRTTRMPKDKVEFLRQGLCWLYDDPRRDMLIAFCNENGRTPSRVSESREEVALGVYLNNSLSNHRQWALDVAEKYPDKREYRAMRYIDETAEWLADENDTDNKQMKARIRNLRNGYFRRDQRALSDKLRGYIEETIPEIIQSPFETKNDKRRETIGRYAANSASMSKAARAANRSNWRKAYREGTLEQEFIDMLETVPGWTW